MSALAERSRTLLSALGATADEIAASLAATGIVGWPCDAEHCAIATYLHRNGVPVAWVDPEGDEDGFVGFSGAAPMAMWPALSEFGSRFDREEYPQLVGDPITAVAIPTQSLPNGRS